MWHQQHHNVAGHIDEPDLVSDRASGHPNTGRYLHGNEPSRQAGLTGYSAEQDQWKSGVGMKGGYSGDSGIYDSSRTDSGFLSGVVSDQLLSDDLTSSARRSGDLSALSEEEDKESKALMRLDSGVDVDVGLNEQFSSLSVDQNSAPNDLSVSSKSQSQDSTPLTNINDLSSSASTTPPTSLQRHHPQQQHHHRPSPPQQQHQQFQAPYDQLYIAQPWDLYFQQDDDGDTQLHIAIIHGFIEVVYSLIHMVPNPAYLDIPNDVCQTPLHLAVLMGQPRIVRQLLVAGARVDIRDREGNTALHLASESGDLECARALMEPVTVQEAQRASLQYSTYLQQVPQDLEERNYDGQMCVHLAAQNEHVDVLRHLLWFGANINAKEGKSGRTVLHYAVERRLPRLCRFLLEECTPQLEVPTYAGYTAYQLASCIDEAMAKQLLQKGAVACEIPEDSDSDSDFSDDEMYQESSDGNFSSLRLNGQPINMVC